jgi:hypothetical protein
MASKPLRVHRITGATFFDQIFEITLQTGETVIWNVTKLSAAAKAGAFGPPRFARTVDLPQAEWGQWNAEDRAKVDWMKAHPAILEEPAIAIATDNPNFLICCFADGQHRVTARQELGLPEIAFYLVPFEVERSYRVHGL